MSTSCNSRDEFQKCNIQRVLIASDRITSPLAFRVSCAAKSGHCVVLTTLPLILAASETSLRCGMFAIVPIVPIVTGEMRYDSAPQRGLSWQEGGGYEVFE